MATLPRTYNSKHKAHILAAPFSTSPRKLQEVTLPYTDGHDATSASAISLREYEEQLNGLKKENFHLKLRVYFLEEKLGSGSPPAIQGLLEHNVRLQVEVEELRRQLSDKQELLAVAAEAIDVLEQQGSLSNDSVDASLDVTATHNTSKEEIIAKKEQTDEEIGDNESEMNKVAEGLKSGDVDFTELTRLRLENGKALQMIKGCVKKIQQQEKEINKLKIVLAQAQEEVKVQGNLDDVGKYEEILKCKNEHIKDLELKVKELQIAQDQCLSDDNSGNLQLVLTRRLQNLAFFLDKLLYHKCVLGEEKKKLAESILRQSLALPVGLQLDESIAPGELTMDESTLDMSQSLRLEDLTMMFGHHNISCEDGFKQSLRKPKQAIVTLKTEGLSESECWSEPDRNVSLARIGLGEVVAGHQESPTEINRHRTRRSRVSYGSRSDEMKSDNALLEEINQLNKHIEQLMEQEKILSSELNESKSEIAKFIAETDNLKVCLEEQRKDNADKSKSIELLQQNVDSFKSRLEDTEQRLSHSVVVIEQLRSEKQEMETNFLETERALRRAADEATVQASQSVLDRAKAQHERLRIERELEATREKLKIALDDKSELQVQLTNVVTIDTIQAAIPQEFAFSEEDRPSSPDQGIDSDRLSSLEHTDAVPLSPRALYEENVILKQKLARSKANFAETFARLNASNIRKKSIQRAICRELHKTHGVLRLARDQFENQQN